MDPLRCLAAALTTMLLSASLASANPFIVPDKTTADVYGWSPDGRYVAFVETTVLDSSSGAVHSELNIVDSATNTLLNNYSLESEPANGLVNEQELYQRTVRGVLEKGGGRLAELRIAYNRPGTVLWQSKLQKAQTMSKLATAADTQQTFKVLVHDRTWTFRLSTFDYAVNSVCPTNGAAYPARGLVLSVSAVMPLNTVMITTLQKDGAALPATRQCAEIYRPTEVRVQGNYMSVLLAVTHPSGSNGYNTVNYMLVTGIRPTR
ncbi:DUF2259 domain-containing protein [Deinococcus marmoris]|uniref:DUF2259 domain-containing protein n=1 Tax=Deinococcus marmoris TaxID=249408 RepID=A0A1U7NVN1_9DEIO|nr:DUF2259 domain-containing protein [Deinococcus marmoris]OLV16960.1 hypothetical protein BOO71_0010249 [Deinococcus marmoris]